MLGMVDVSMQMLGAVPVMRAGECLLIAPLRRCVSCEIHAACAFMDMQISASISGNTSECDGGDIVHGLSGRQTLSCSTLVPRRASLLEVIETPSDSDTFTNIQATHEYDDR